MLAHGHPVAGSAQGAVPVSCGLATCNEVFNETEREQMPIPRAGSRNGFPPRKRRRSSPYPRFEWELLLRVRAGEGPWPGMRRRLAL